MNKYATNPDEDEVLPNLLGLSDKVEIEQSEFEGFLYANIVLENELNISTSFNVNYIFNLHKLALGHLYSFAGRCRQVNISKNGFQFPPAMFLEQNMMAFNEEILLQLPKKYVTKEELIKSIAKVHGELLFIHPFREGNGRTARLLANLMARQQGYDDLKFEKINEELFSKYVKAVQLSSIRDYNSMEEIISTLF